MFKVSYAAFQSATLCRGKNDTRHYVNGVHLDAEGFIVATDGAILFTGKVETEASESITVDVLGKAPSKFDYVEIDSTSAKFYSDKAGFLSALAVRFVDCRYPDWRRVTKFTEGQISSIAFAGSYLHLLEKAGKFYGKKSVKLEFQSATDACRIALSDTDFIVLMPVRIK
ncbi:hypothetical protein G3R67_003418 [Salmonella enterica subsp. enterica serovar Agona]|nr:hypothetical protein [Salmonella enterica subsp. enterica serovar Agona]EJW5798232.1 hypothetical protein [Salmonella enterica]